MLLLSLQENIFIEEFNSIKKNLQRIGMKFYDLKISTQVINKRVVACVDVYFSYVSKDLDIIEYIKLEKLYSKYIN